MKLSACGELEIDAGEFVATLEHRQGLKIACLEEIALHKGYTTFAAMEPTLARFGKSSYAMYIHRIAVSLS